MKFKSYESLIRLLHLNGVVDMEGVKITETQLENLQDYIAKNRLLRWTITKIDRYGMIIVDKEEDSSFAF